MLAVFLVLAITVMIKLIQILQTLKRLAAKAEHMTDLAESVSQNISRAFVSLPLIRWFEKIANAFQSSDEGKSKRNEKGGQ